MNEEIKRISICFFEKDLKGRKLRKVIDYVLSDEKFQDIVIEAIEIIEEEGKDFNE